jgi:transcriptional regulator with XRE-family HTH domain
MSQLDLSARTGVSQRHLSFVETGRSKPSRELVLHLAEGLDVPLRDRNVLLQAAGFAPEYRETEFDAPELASIRSAIDLLISGHDPYPAVVIDRHWNLVRTNDGASAMTAAFADPDAIAESRGNLLRLLLHPKGFRRHIVNLDETVAATRARLEREIAADPRDRALRELVEEVMSDLPVRTRKRDHLSRPGIVTEVPHVLALHLRVGETELQMFSTLASIGTALDVTVQEVVIELFFPADSRTEKYFRSAIRR